MAEEKKIILTNDGLKKLEEELENLKVVRRKEVAAKIKEARMQGDLSENAEYDAAKEEQAEIETRITQIEKMLRNAEVIDDDNVSGDIITVGSKVRIWDTDLEEEVDYAIVGSAEADPMNTENAKISNESPVGRGLLGHKVGDTVEIETPGGIVELKVLAISR